MAMMVVVLIVMVTTMMMNLTSKGRVQKPPKKTAFFAQKTLFLGQFLMDFFSTKISISSRTLRLREQKSRSRLEL